MPLRPGPPAPWAISTLRARLPVLLSSQPGTEGRSVDVTSQNHLVVISRTDASIPDSPCPPENSRVL